MSNVFKTTLIGDTTTGKTSLVRRIKYDTFLCNTECTVGVSFIKLDRDNLKYELWDTAGQERFFALLPMYFRNSRIIIFVFDLSDNDSLNAFDKYVGQFNILSDYKLIIVGNKLDLVTESQVKYIQNEVKTKFEKSNVMDKIFGYTFTSAKTGQGCAELVDMMDRCAKGMENIVQEPTIKLDNVETQNSWCLC
jgi:small GTP-binding protein